MTLSRSYDKSLFFVLTMGSTLGHASPYPNPDKTIRPEASKGTFVRGEKVGRLDRIRVGAPRWRLAYNPTRITNATEPEPPLAATVPILQVTTPLLSTPPPEAETNKLPMGRASVITTLVASALPLFE